MKWIIYKHTNKINGKVYIGQTKLNPNYRWRDGKGYLRYGDTHFARAIKRYGWKNFTHEIIEKDIPTLELANERETYWIKRYNSVKNGYNANYGGDNKEPSDETRAKLSAKSKLMWSDENHKKIIGYKSKIMWQDENYRIKMRKKLKQIMSNPEYGKKISIQNKGRIHINKNNLIEKKIKVNELQKYIDDGWTIGRISGRKRKTSIEIYCVELDRYFHSTVSAGKELGINRNNIRVCCENWSRTAGKDKLHFCYAKDKNDFQIIRQNKDKIKKVVCVELNKTFNSIQEASTKMNIHNSNISQCLHNRQKTAGGYHWKYVE